jgi:hypothetical protein
MIIDDQSNRSLASPAFFDMFNILDKPENYTLSTCSGIIATSGRRGRGFVVESVHRDIHLSLPTLIECDHIPDNRDEIPTPQVVQNHFHLHDLAGTIQPLDDSCQILLLIGRDLPVAHHVLDQKVGSDRGPYAQQLTRVCAGLHGTPISPLRDSCSFTLNWFSQGCRVDGLPDGKT